MNDRRGNDRRRKHDRRASDRRQPSLVETVRGERNIWKHQPGDKLLEDLESLELSIDSEEPAELDDGNPYNRADVIRRR